MTSYFAIVHKDEGSAFGVSFPDLPGVFSAADDQADIVTNAIQALRLWAEDEALPAPSTIEAIAAREDVRADLAEGAFIVRVPLVDTDSRVVRANVSFEAGVLAAIDAAAKERGLTRAAFLAAAARHEIERSA